MERIARYGIHLLFGLLATLAISGCVSSARRIQQARNEFLSDPQTYSYSFDGKLVGKGAPHQFLLNNDPYFGDFLLQNLPTTKSAEFARITLDYFIWSHHDDARLSRATELIPDELWSAKISAENTDVISMCTLRDYLHQARVDYDKMHPSITR